MHYGIPSPRCVFVFVHVYYYVCLFTYGHVYVCMCLYVCMFVCVVGRGTCTMVFCSPTTGMCVCMCACICMFVHIRNAYVCM